MTHIKEKIEILIEENELKTKKFLSALNPAVKWSIVGSALLLLPVFLASKYISQWHFEKKFRNEMVFAKKSFENPDSLKIEHSPVFMVASETYSAMVVLKNPNLDLHLKNLPIDMVFYSQDNTILNKQSFVISAAPDETVYVLAKNFKASQKPARAEIFFPKKENWQKRNDLPKVKLSSTLPTYKISGNSLEITSSVRNDSPYQIAKITGNFLLYGKNNKLFAATQRNELTVKSKETRDIKIIWNNFPYPEDIAKIESVWQTNILDTANLNLGNNLTPPAGDTGRIPENNFQY